MTNARRKWHHALLRAGCMLGAAWLMVAVTTVAPAGPASAGDMRHYWTDTQTGLAIGGYDPLAYFVDGKPRLGSTEFEAEWAGVHWRFVNAGNRAAFLDAPEFYAPQFGGYSAYAVAQGRAVQGNPLIWAVQRQRLYLFYSPAHKHLWQSEPDEIAAAAATVWPRLELTLDR